MLIRHVGVIETSLQTEQYQLGDDEEVLSDNDGADDFDSHDPHSESPTMKEFDNGQIQSAPAKPEITSIRSLPTCSYDAAEEVEVVVCNCP